MSNCDELDVEVGSELHLGNERLGEGGINLVAEEQPGDLSRVEGAVSGDG